MSLPWSVIISNRIIWNRSYNGDDKGRRKKRPQFIRNRGHKSVTRQIAYF